MGQCASSSSSHGVDPSAAFSHDAVYKPVKEQSHRKEGSTKKRRKPDDNMLSNFGHGDGAASTLLDNSNMTASLTYRTSENSSHFLRGSNNSRTKQEAPVEFSASLIKQQKEDYEELKEEEDEETDVDLDDSSLNESELLERSMACLQDDEHTGTGTSVGTTASRRQQNKSSLSSLPSLQSMTYLDNKKKKEERIPERQPHSSWCDLSFSDDSYMDETYQNHRSISHSIDSTSTDGEVDGGHEVRRSRKLAMCNLLGSSKFLIDDNEEEELFKMP